MEKAIQYNETDFLMMNLEDYIDLDGFLIIIIFLMSKLNMCYENFSFRIRIRRVLMSALSFRYRV